MDDKEFQFKPYYKSRNLDDRKIPFNQRLPKPIVDDLIKYFNDNDMNQTDGMTYLALEFLNNHCFERTSFNYIAFFITFKDYDLKSDDLILLGIFDGYKMIKELDDKINLGENRDGENDEDDTGASKEVESPEFDYLTTHKINKLNEISLVLEEGNVGFKQFSFNPQIVDREEVVDKESLFKFLENKYDKPIDEFYYCGFNLNNYLDVKSGGIYKGFGGLKYNNMHKGIQILKDKNGKKYYITYRWHFVNLPLEFYVNIIELHFHSKDEWFGIVTDSTNKKLKNFINKQDDFKEIRKENVLKEIEDIDKKIRELQKRKDKCKNMIANIVDDNTLINKIE